MIAAIVIFVSLLILFVLISRIVPRRRKDSEDVFHLNARQREVDIEVLSLLLSAEENEYLRKSLPREQFRRVRRERLSLARRYLEAIKANTTQFIRAAETVKCSSDAELAQAAHELLLIAFRVRLNVPVVQLCLVLEWLFPSLSLVAPLRLDRYREMGGRIAVILERLQARDPTRFSLG
jgi:hypothetical protein